MPEGKESRPVFPAGLVVQRLGSALKAAEPFLFRKENMKKLISFVILGMALMLVPKPIARDIPPPDPCHPPSSDDYIDFEGHWHCGNAQ
jgi:hypothetical protein